MAGDFAGLLDEVLPGERVARVFTSVGDTAFSFFFFMLIGLDSQDYPRY
jgi:hypothetical protein